MYNFSQREKQMMTRYIDMYAANDDLRIVNSPDRADIDTILAPWWQEKNKYLTHLFPEGKLMISREVSYDKSLDEIIKELRDNEIIGRFYDKAYKEFCAKDPFPDSCWYNTLGDKLLNWTNLAENRYDHAEEVMLADGTPYKISKGAKVMRVLKIFSESYGIPGFEEFRLEHSRILNQSKLYGHLVLSIHPFDFMTMSDNDCNWHSCMSWTNNGEYRLGTVEMMNSPYVVEAYLESSESFYPFDDDGMATWTNKKWRELFVVHPNGIFGIKGYPFWNRTLEDTVLKILKPLVEENLNWGPYKDTITNAWAEEENEGGYLQTDDDNHYYLYTDWMYNDFRYEHHMFEKENPEESVDITYSGPCECMICGQTHNIYFEEGNDLVCDDCYDPKEKCPICGERLHVCDMMPDVLNPSKRICPTCFNKKYKKDIVSGMYMPCENTVSVEFKDGLWNTRGIRHMDKDKYDKLQDETKEKLKKAVFDYSGLMDIVAFLKKI